MPRKDSRPLSIWLGTDALTNLDELAAAYEVPRSVVFRVAMRVALNHTDELRRLLGSQV